jgi:hypothetical protein
MLVRVDRDLCESNAVCARLVPEVFEVGEDDQLRLKQERPWEARPARVGGPYGAALSRLSFAITWSDSLGDLSCSSERPGSSAWWISTSRR